MKAIFTICSSNYLSQALSLKKSIADHCKDVLFVIILSDRTPTYLSDDQSIIEVEKLNIPMNEFQQLLDTYNIIEFNTALKPFAFEYINSELHADQIIYLDPDILVYQDLKSLFDALTNYDFIVTPHIIAPITNSKIDYLTLGTINTGIFNLGFFAASMNQEGKQFIAWWKNHLLKYGHNDILNGQFYDQKVINLLPIFSDKLLILKEPGYNVAEWNLHERALSKKDTVYYVNDKILYFFHFSSVKISNYTANLELNRQFKRDGSPVLKELIENYIHQNQLNGFEQLKSVPCHYILRPNIHRASRKEVYMFKLRQWFSKK